MWELLFKYKLLMMLVLGFIAGLLVFWLFADLMPYWFRDRSKDVHVEYLRSEIDSLTRENAELREALSKMSTITADENASSDSSFIDALEQEINETREIIRH